MMYKEKSKRSALIKYLTVIPVFLLLLFVFSSHTTNPKLKEDVQEQMDLRAEIGDAETAKNIGKVVEGYLAKEDNYEEAIDAIEAIASQHGFSISIDKKTVTRIAFDKPMQRSEEIDLGLIKFYKGDEGDEVVKFNFKDKGKVAIRFEREGDKVKFAEVVPEQSEITDRETLKDALKTFYDLPVPPPPPSPPAAPKALKALIPPPPPPPPGAPECTDVFKVVEQMPRFPGCEHLADKGKSSLEIEQCAKEKMINYIYSNVKYPKDARKTGVQGTVVIQFVVESDGAVAGIKLLRDPGSGLGSEAVRVVQSFNSMDEQWTPGKHKGKNVDVIYTLPVKFKLDGDDEKVDKIISVGEAQNVINLESISSDPIIFIDGKEVEKGASNDLDPDDIATINVFKGEKAIAKFGAKAVNGVLDIVTKAALKSDNDKEVFIVVEEMPRFPGCEDIQNKSERHDCSKQNLLAYIYENVKYSDEAKKAGTEGTSVVQFTITKTGYVDDIKLLRDPGNGLGEEATKVVKLMQEEITWIPGKQRGKVVSVKYTLPIKFKLKDKHTKEDVRNLELKNFSLSPNPSSGRFRLQFEGEAGPVRIDIRDMAGNLLHQLDDEDFLGRFDEEVVHPSFVKKSAIVTIIQGDKSTSKKIIFQ